MLRFWPKLALNAAASCVLLGGSIASYFSQSSDAQKNLTLDNLVFGVTAVASSLTLTANIIRGYNRLRGQRPAPSIAVELERVPIRTQTIAVQPPLILRIQPPETEPWTQRVIDEATVLRGIDISQRISNAL